MDLCLRCTNGRIYSVLEKPLYKQNVSNHETSALSWACKHGKRSLVGKLLLLIRTTPRPYSQCPLNLATLGGHAGTAEFLLAHDSGIISQFLARLISTSGQYYQTMLWSLSCRNLRSTSVMKIIAIRMMKNGTSCFYEMCNMDDELCEETEDEEEEVG